MDYKSQFRINRLEDENDFLKRTLDKVSKENKNLKSQLSICRCKLKKANDRILIYKHNISKTHVKLLRTLSQTLQSRL